jgi:hypothetical protein
MITWMTICPCQLPWIIDRAYEKFDFSFGPINTTVPISGAANVPLCGIFYGKEFRSGTVRSVLS